MCRIDPIWLRFGVVACLAAANGACSDDASAAVQAMGCYAGRAVLGMVETVPYLGFQKTTLGLTYPGGWTTLGPTRSGGLAAIASFAGQLVVGGPSLFF